MLQATHIILSQQHAPELVNDEGVERRGWAAEALQETLVQDGLSGARRVLQGHSHVTQRHHHQVRHHDVVTEQTTLIGTTLFLSSSL